MNKHSPPTKVRLLEAQVMQMLKKVATEFAVFDSGATGNADSKDSSAAILTSVGTDAVDRPRADVRARADKPQQRADAFAAHIVWLSEAPLLRGRAYLLKAGWADGWSNGHRA